MKSSGYTHSRSISDGPQRGHKSSGATCEHGARDSSEFFCGINRVASGFATRKEDEIGVEF
jgi:hypothetical protein